jgi:hypothetical protein
MGHRIGGGGLLLWTSPPVNAKTLRCELQPGLVCGVNRALVKLFTLDLVQRGIDPLPALPCSTMSASNDFTLFRWG